MTTFVSDTLSFPALYKGRIRKVGTQRTKVMGKAMKSKEKISSQKSTHPWESRDFFLLWSLLCPQHTGLL